MAEIKHGTVAVTIADELALPPEAGSLSPEEVSHLPKAPRGIGLAITNAADALEKAGERFTAPKGVSKAALLAAAERADGIDQVIVDLEVVLTRLKQANLLFDAQAWELLRTVNDQVRAQGKRDPELLAMFSDVLNFFSRGPRTQRPPAAAGS
jgi:ABC-type transporter Mla subunit MlaD